MTSIQKTEIDKLSDLASGPDNIAICGVGGIGKTSLLRHLYRYQMDNSSCYLAWIQYSGDIKKDVLESCLFLAEMTRMAIEECKVVMKQSEETQ